MKNRKAAGISLVALVITIIVLIILTGAVIVTFMEGGIIDRAKESVFKNDMRTYQETLALKRAENQMEIALGEKEDVEINASTLAEIQAIIPEFKEEYEGLVVITNGELSIGERVTGDELSSSEELYATWLSDLEIGLSRLPKNALALVKGLEVGDYVKYIPEGNNITSYELLYEDSGYFEDKDWSDSCDEGEEINQTIERQDINWRVLKNDRRQVTLISERPIDEIGLGQEKGYENGPRILDDIYATLYSGSKGTARNLKVEDINEIMKIEIGKDVSSIYIDRDGNEVEVEEGTTYGDILDLEGYDINNLEIGYPISEKYRNYEISHAYGYQGSKYKERNEEAYKLIFRNVKDTGYVSKYWLSSTYVRSYFDYDFVDFIVCSVMGGYMNYENLDGGMWVTFEMSSKCGRPIVVLNSDVEVANPSAGGDSVDTAWKLK